MANRLAPPNINMLRDDAGNLYAVPAQPSFRTQQQVAIPNYRTMPTYDGSYVHMRTPEIAYIDPKESSDITRAHELQHQIEGMSGKKGQHTFRVNSEKTGDVIDTGYSGHVEKAWNKNAQQLGYDGKKAEQLLRDKLSAPEVEKYLQKIGFNYNAYLRNPDMPEARLYELLADISSYETAKKTDLTKDPFLAKTVFNDPKLNLLIKSTTGMSGVVAGDSDYAPYSLEAARAWGAQLPPTMLDKLRGMFRK